MPPRGKSPLNSQMIVKALNDVNENRLSYRAAATKYNVSQSSLIKYEKLITTRDNAKRKLLKNSYIKCAGVFSEDEELMFVEMFLVLAAADIKLNESIVELVVQSYLMHSKRQIEYFKDGTFPNHPWINYFITRYTRQLPPMLWTKNRSTDDLFRFFDDLQDIWNDKLCYKSETMNED